MRIRLGVSLVIFVSSLLILCAHSQSVSTAIGDLDFVNGYPTEKTAAALYDAMDLQRATQAYIWGLPAVGFHGLHVAQLKTFGAQDGDLVLYSTLKDKTGMLTPNLTTIYAMSFWNMAEKGPLVVEVPPGATAGGVLDIWQRPITDTGQTGPDKGNGGKYLILPPGSKDVDAPGFIVKHSETNQLWFATRGLSADPKEAEATLRKHKLYAWKDRANPPTLRVVPVDGKDWTSNQPQDFNYWRYLSAVLSAEPTEPRDSFFIAMLAPLGIEKGKPFSPNERQTKILTEAAVLGDLMARTTAYEKRFPNATVFPRRHWEYANLVELDQQTKEYGQLDERASWFYEAIGNSTGMQGRTVGFGQVYLETSKDKDGDWIDGGKSYHMRVAANPPVKQFWSITLYDNLTRGPVITDQGAADLSSRKNLAKNTDGSVDLYFGPEKPAGSNDNWVKTSSGKGWFAYFRFYGPTQAYFDKSWSLDDLDKVK